MKLESCKRLGIGGSSAGIGGRLPTERSSSLDSTDEDSKIRLDDPSLRLQIVDSPTNPPDITFGEFVENSSKTSSMDLDSNINTHTAANAQHPN